MNGDDLRTLSAGAVVDADGAEQEDGVVSTREQADALADLIEVVWTLMEWADNHIDAVIDALAALDQEPPT